MRSLSMYRRTGEAMSIVPSRLRHGRPCGAMSSALPLLAPRSICKTVNLSALGYASAGSTVAILSSMFFAVVDGYGGRCYGVFRSTRVAQAGRPESNATCIERCFPVDSFSWTVLEAVLDQVEIVVRLFHSCNRDGPLPETTRPSELIYPQARR